MRTGLKAWLGAALVLLVVVLPACRDRMQDPLRDDAGVTAAGAADGGVGAAPGAVEFTLRSVLPDAGVEAIPTEAEAARPEIAPTQTLALDVTGGLRNYRVRLFDEVDRAMVSDDVQSDVGGTLSYRIQLPEPLKTGHRYTLVIDSQSGATMLDARGEPVADQRIEFRVAGEKEKPAPPPKPARRRRGG